MSLLKAANLTPKPTLTRNRLIYHVQAVLDADYLKKSRSSYWSFQAKNAFSMYCRLICDLEIVLNMWMIDSCETVRIAKKVISLNIPRNIIFFFIIMKQIRSASLKPRNDRWDSLEQVNTIFLKFRAII